MYQLAARRHTRRCPVSALKRLSDQEVAALARFILRHAAKSGCFHWRTRFAECARRGGFAPAAECGDESTLTSLYRRPGAVVLYGVRTNEVLTAASELSLAQAVGRPTLPAAHDSKTVCITAQSDGVTGSHSAS
jgi:hypothetical protein